MKTTKPYFPLLLFQNCNPVNEILGECVVIQSKATKAYYPVVLFQTFEPVDEILNV